MDAELAMMSLEFVLMLRIFVLIDAEFSNAWLKLELMLRTLSLMDAELAMISLELALMLNMFVLIYEVLISI